MKKNKIIIAIIAVLAILTGVFAIMHNQTREVVPEGALKITIQDKDCYVDLDSMTMTDVTGSVINGKGEEMEINTKAISLLEVLESVDIHDMTEVTVYADDEFSATLDSSEVKEEGKAYLSKEEDDSISLIVFGDPNMKRNVRNVVRIDVQ